ncbi:MAG TPA: DUF6159 family protein [Fimbriimonas sp.]|nr:DUF6159 family protein [Fimbriimonas sp.]
MFGDRFNRSWQVAKESYAVLKANPSLAFFPVISGLATLIVSIPFIAALILTSIGEHHVSKNIYTPMHYLVTAAMYFANYFVIIFFNAALVACANENLQGRPTTMSFGMRAAVQRLPQIIGWAAIASTVGMILRLISERTGVVGSIVSSIVGLAWNVAVFFVVPVLVIDRESPLAAIKTSTGMIKQTWGERIILGIGVGTAMGILGLLVLIPIALAIGALVAGIWALGIFFFITAAMFILVLSVVGSAMTTIYQTALYLYCRTNMIPHGFQPSSLQGAFAPKPDSKVSSFLRR